MSGNHSFDVFTWELDKIYVKFYSIEIEINLFSSCSPV